MAADHLPLIVFLALALLLCAAVLAAARWQRRGVARSSGGAGAAPFRLSLRPALLAVLAVPFYAGVCLVLALLDTSPPAATSLPPDRTLWICLAVLGVGGSYVWRRWEEW